jgi:kynurenine formamidase
MSDKSHISDILEAAPSNWGKWGTEDEIGAVNRLDSEAVLRGIAAIEDGTVLTLGAPINDPDGDPVWPNSRRSPPETFMVTDKGHVEAGKLDREPFGFTEAANDVIHMSTHGPTHVDSLAHVWYDDRLYNGFDANTTKGGLDRCGIKNLGEHGIVGRGVLLDIARHRGVDSLDPGSRIKIEEIESCAETQNLDIGSRDIVLLRTGILEVFYEEGPEVFYDRYAPGGTMNEPGLTYTDETAAWFHDREISFFGTDTFASEQTQSEECETLLPLHPALLRDLGIPIGEKFKLDELSERCADRDSSEFFFSAAPLKIVAGTASPINPIAIL